MHNFHSKSPPILEADPIKFSTFSVQWDSCQSQVCSSLIAGVVSKLGWLSVRRGFRRASTWRNCLEWGNYTRILMKNSKKTSWCLSPWWCAWCGPACCWQCRCRPPGLLASACSPSGWSWWSRHCPGSPCTRSCCRQPLTARCQCSGCPHCLTWGCSGDSRRCRRAGKPPLRKPGWRCTQRPGSPLHSPLPQQNWAGTQPEMFFL